MRIFITMLLMILVFSMISYSSNRTNEYKNWPILKGQYLGQKPPGLKPEIFAPGIISTKDKFELNSVFSSNGKEFYYCISASTPEEKAKGNYFYELWFTEMINNIWTKPKQLKIAGKYSVADIALSPDGKRLYFCSKMPNLWKDAKGFDILYVKRTKTGWSKPINPGKNINSKYGETQPSFTSDGMMYFSSKRKRLKNSGDLYYSKFSNGKFLKYEILPNTINTIYGEGDSFIAPMSLI